MRARSTVKPEPAPIDDIDVHLVNPTEPARDLSLVAIEPGRYEAETPTVDPGAWQVAVAVHRLDLPDAVADVEWAVRAPISNGPRPFEVVTTTLTTILVAAAMGAVLFTRRRPRKLSYPTHLLEHPR